MTAPDPPHTTRDNTAISLLTISILCVGYCMEWLILFHVSVSCVLCVYCHVSLSLPRALPVCATAHVQTLWHCSERECHLACSTV